MMKHFTRPLAVLALAGLTACGGGSGSTVAPPTNPSPAPKALANAGVPFVGVGDSLTAGYQSSGFLGDPTSTSPLSLYPGGAVPPGQENGFWSLVYQQLTSTPTAAMYNGPTSPLPLIKGPGLADQLVLSASLLSAVQSPCNAFNTQAYSPQGWAATRISTANSVTDLGVPGITMHEAIAMSSPLTGPANGPNCGYLTITGDPTSGGLQSLVAGESELFYPVLGGFQSNFPGNSLTELNVATALKPKLATVWLGANDLLKYIFSNGQSPVSDTPTQMAADHTQIVKSLNATGSKVLVADLPNVLTTPQFFPDAKLTPDFTVLLAANGVPLAYAPTFAAEITAQLESAYKINGGGYLTETGFLGTVQQAATIIAGATSAPPDFTKISLDPSGPGSGAGGAYITPAFAAQITAINTAYNTAIDSVGSGSGTSVALVPITATFTNIAANGVTLAPGETATLQFGGGLLSWDGLHPSNLGYAVIANVFIGTADTAFGMTIPPLSNAQIGAIASQDPYDPFVIKAINPLSPFPLP